MKFSYDGFLEYLLISLKQLQKRVYLLATDQ